MAGQADTIRNVLEELAKEGFQLVKSGDPDELGRSYQRWYTRSLPLVRQLLPDRLNDFTLLYEGTKDENGIRDSLLGFGSGFPRERLQAQACILESAAERLDDKLNNLRGLLQADLFDSEIDAARHLRENGHWRAAGAVAGVVLEAHLKEIADKHQIPISTKTPTLAVLNQALKDADILDIPTWRWIQRLGDLRNLCDHKKEREPTPDEVDELIDGADKVTKTLS